MTSSPRTVPTFEGFPKHFTLDDGTAVEVRPLAQQDHEPLHGFFSRIPEEDLYYLKDNVTDLEVIREWTHNINHERVIALEAIVDGEIVCDATIHRTRAFSRRHIGELRVVVDPAYRQRGLGSIVIRELLDIAKEINLYKVYIDLVPRREEAAIRFAERMGFERVATLPARIMDYYGGYLDVVVMEVSLSDRSTWWRP